METCELMPSCPLYNKLKERNQSALESIKKEYCENNFSQCAINMIYITHGPNYMSRYLSPEDIQTAHMVLDDLY